MRPGPLLTDLPSVEKMDTTAIGCKTRARKASLELELTMIDNRTNQRLLVSTSPNGKSHIELLYSQAEKVHQLLEFHGIRHWVGEDIFSFNGGPQEVVISLAWREDAKAVQAVLDSVP